ncbi:hypothetical protein ALC57_14601 [Trachymyrmex cornetzi]|uniref:Uncharacterized protein n=1 Tax=Trachymyrmex cornetzi TaxID=471704 RepID=A0A151IY38_9HYME|nr:hypothetical protein ALC57_14601 [Trachymyrmex cornetzi]
MKRKTIREYLTALYSFGSRRKICSVCSVLTVTVHALASCPDCPEILIRFIAYLEETGESPWIETEPTIIAISNARL